MREVACLSVGTGGTGLGTYAGELLPRLADRLDVVGIDDPVRSVSILGREVGGYVSRMAWNLLGDVSGFDVVHAFDLLTFHRGSDVLTVHDTYVFDHPHHYGLGGSFWRWWMRRARRVPVLIANSEYTKRCVVEHLGVEPGRVVVTPLAPSSWVHRLDDVESGEAPMVLMVGDVKSTKANVEVLEALEALGRTVHLHRAGPRTSSGYADRFFSLCQATENVKVFDHGYVGRQFLNWLYNRADVLAFPSVDEGFGLPVLEAAKVGTPSVVSDHPVFEETIGGLGVRHEDLTEAFRIALDEPVPGDRLRSWAGRFTWEETARVTVGAYEKVV